MLNIDEIQNGIVIDHIKAGTAVGLMELLGITGNKTGKHSVDNFFLAGAKLLVAKGFL